MEPRRQRPPPAGSASQDRLGPGISCRAGHGASRIGLVGRCAVRRAVRGGLASAFAAGWRAGPRWGGLALHGGVRRGQLAGGRPGARRRPGDEELPLGTGGALAGVHHAAAAVTARLRNDGRSALPAHGGAVSLPLPLRHLRRGAAHAQGGPGARRHHARTGRQPGAIPRRGRRVGGALRAFLRARRGDSPRHAGTRLSRILPAFDRVTLSPRRRDVSRSWRVDAGSIAPTYREGGIMSPLILFQGQRSKYDEGTVAQNGVNFRLEKGETVALLGANGSGKTTFALHLNGLLTGEGTVEVCGLPMNPRNLVEIRRKIGLVFQDSESQLFMPTVLEDVAFRPLNHGLSPRQAAEPAVAALAQVGMPGVAGKAPYHLSAGEKKRVAIAGILAVEPDILVLDEPTTFLDPPGQRALAQLLSALPQAKILIT